VPAWNNAGKLGKHNLPHVAAFNHLFVVRPPLFLMVANDEAVGTNDAPEPPTRAARDKAKAEAKRRVKAIPNTHWL
jgi:hypothetical protein